jgi:hypothetical protein
LEIFLKKKEPPFEKMNKKATFASPYREVSEWLKEHAWKVCIPLKGIEGSNPFLSAEKPAPTGWVFLFQDLPRAIVGQLK